MFPIDKGGEAILENIFENKAEANTWPIIVYQAYGRHDIRAQVLFSLLSLFYHQNQYYKTHPGASTHRKLVLIYTDDAGYFQNFLKDLPLGFEIQYEKMTPNRLQEWRGAIHFVHRVKIEMLIHAHESYPDSNLLYLDGDTYFTKWPQELFEKISDQTSLMHICENKINLGRDPLSKKIHKFLKKNVFHLEGQQFKIPLETSMWNAGVLGISSKMAAIFPSVLQFTDQAYALYPKHVMEQLAFSYFLQSKGTIFPSDKVIYHYWDQKEQYDQLICDYFLDNTELTKAINKYCEVIWPKRAEKTLGFIRRILQRLQKKSLRPRV